jgi:YfiH family protein
MRPGPPRARVAHPERHVTVAEPALVETTLSGVTCLADPALRDGSGIVVAFSERTGGRSRSPYSALNLAAHVGDDPAVVDDNRCALLASLGLEKLRDSLTMADQVHGVAVREVAGASAGLGAYARAGSPPPIPATDALLTLEEDVPLMLCYADCVPVVLVATQPVRAVAVVHAGWRGALESLPGKAAQRLAATAGCATSDLTAYVGPHIGACCYEVDETLLSQFVNAFGRIAAAQGRLDLGAVVSQSLNEVGVPLSSQLNSGLCTADLTDRFYSYRAEGATGRHAAIACILGTVR